MARVTATKGNRLTKKPEVAIQDSIRKLIKSLMEMNFATKEFKDLQTLQNSKKAEILQTILDNFGEAIFVMVDSAVVNELQLIDEDENDAEEQISDGY